jgi:class 3 adenylate cyclase
MTTPLSVHPRHRSIVAVDIEGSTKRNNQERAVLRNAMYDLVEEALRLSDIKEHHRDFVDRGDGVLILVHPVDELPKTVLLASVIPTLFDLLVQHEADRPNESFRLRAAVHAGEVHYDNRGWYGEDLDITFRLLDAPEVKRKLRQTQAPLVLVVSQHIYGSVIRQGYAGIDDSTFEQIVQVQIGGQRTRGWVQVPGAVSNGHDLTA